jgi:hypothetical protein
MTEAEMNEYFKILWKYLPPGVVIVEADKAKLLDIESRINTELKSSAAVVNQQYIDVMKENAAIMSNAINEQTKLVKEQIEIFKKCESNLYNLTTLLAELVRKK